MTMTTKAILQKLVENLREAQKALSFQQGRSVENGTYTVDPSAHNDVDDAQVALDYFIKNVL
jgi:hypothetical protein